MSRTKYGTLLIGEISHGTLILHTLVDRMVDTLQPIKMAAIDRQTVRRAATYVGKLDPDNVTDGQNEELLYTLDELLQLASCYTPPFTCVGGHESDPACYGVWVDHDSLDQAEGDGCLLRHDGPPPMITDDPSMQQPDYYLQVNDHGNATLWVKSGKNAKRWSMVWEVV